jgi:hypothetical protein
VLGDGVEPGPPGRVEKGRPGRLQLPGRNRRPGPGHPAGIIYAGM